MHITMFFSVSTCGFIFLLASQYATNRGIMGRGLAQKNLVDQIVNVQST